MNASPRRGAWIACAIAVALGAPAQKPKPIRSVRANPDPTVTLSSFLVTEDADRIVLCITAVGDVLHNGKSIGARGVTPLITKLRKTKDRAVVIQCSRDTPPLALFRVHSAAQKAGAKTVSIATASPTTLGNRPVPVRQVTPRISNELRREGPAKVVIHLLVNAAGHVERARVYHSTDHRFDKPTLDAVRQWRFQPATEDGQPISMEVRLPVEFPTDKNASSDRRTAAALREPPLAQVVANLQRRQTLRAQRAAIQAIQAAREARAAAKAREKARVEQAKLEKARRESGKPLKIDDARLDALLELLRKRRGQS